MPSIPEGTELREEARVSAQECQDAAQVPEATTDYPKVKRIKLKAVLNRSLVMI